MNYVKEVVELDPVQVAPTVAVLIGGVTEGQSELVRSQQVEGAAQAGQQGSAAAAGPIATSPVRSLEHQAPERRGYEMSLGLTDYTTEYLASLVRPGVAGGGHRLAEPHLTPCLTFQQVQHYCGARPSSTVTAWCSARTTRAFSAHRSTAPFCWRPKG